MKKLSIIVILILVTLFATFYIWFKGIANKIFIPHAGTVSATSETIANDLLNGIPFNILLLGYGGGNHDGPYLTDSIIIAHIDPMQNKVLVISVPRDIWVKIPTSGTDTTYLKINAAYEIGLDDQDYPDKQSQFKGAAGGSNLAKYVIGQVTGMPIKYFIGVDFAGFVKTIDAIGGVDIDVETAFDDPQYPNEGHETDLCNHTKEEVPDLEKIATVSPQLAYPCRYITLHFNKGVQHMNGDLALKYVRSRHSLQDGTDFGRSKRQRNLLIAVKQKVMSINFISRIIPFISSLQDDFRTDLSFDDMKTFLQNANILNKFTIINLAITDQNYLTDSFSDDGQAILLPKSGKDQWGQIQNWIASYTNPNASLSSPVIQVANGTSIMGLAQVATNRLQDKGYNVLNPTYGSTIDNSKTTITVINRKIDKNVLLTLEKEFGVTTTTKHYQDESQYDILVILGNDYYQAQGKKLLNE